MNTFQKIENESEWKDLLGKVLFKTFFHTLEWESFLEKEFSWIKFERYAWGDDLILSVARCRLFGKEKLVSHPLCEYGGPLPLKDGVDWGSFSQNFLEFFGTKARIKFHPYVFNSPQPLPIGRQALLTLKGGGVSTFWIEDFSKKAAEDLWQEFRKTLRQEIRKSEEGGITVSECQGKEELAQFYKLYLDAVRRHKNIPLPFSALNFFLSNSEAKIFLAKKDDIVAGGSIFLFYKPFIHYFISASDKRFREWNIGHRILWHAMQKYVGRPTSGIDYFDLGGTRKGSALEVFKRGWGAKEHAVYEIGTERGGMRNSYLRNVLGAIPTGVMKHINYYVLWMKM